MVQYLHVGLMSKRTIYGSILLLCLAAFSIDLSAQQQSHFTDFRMAPSAINPGLTGAFRGTYRINGIYRSQWGNYGDSKGLKTMVASGEFNLKGGLLLENDWLSAGLNLYSDQAGTANRKYTATGVNIGYHIGMDKDYKNVFSVGVNYSSLNGSVSNHLGLADVRLLEATPNYSSGSFNGNCTLPGCEGQEGGSGGTDLSLGVTYKTELNDNVVRVGLAFNHIKTPETSVARGTGGVVDPGPDPTPDPPIIDPERNRKIDPFRSNIVLHAEASTLLSSKVRLNPALLFMTSAGTTEFQIQSTAEYLLNAKEQFSLIGGLGLRPLPSFDAAYVIGGIRMKDLTVRLSYDLSLSSIKLPGGGNGFEMSVGYIGRIYRDPNVDKIIFCPRL